MTRSIALLRGINVGPTTTVPMVTLRALVASAGATDVTTLLNSGNVVFSGEVDASALQSAIRSETGVPTHVLVLDAARFRRVAAAFPVEFSQAVQGNDSKLTITFMSSVPGEVRIPSDLADRSPELIQVGADAVYQAHPNGISNSKLTPTFWKQFPPEATARNLATVKKLLALL